MAANTPSFFKIMIGDFTNTLRLPVAFTKRLETKLGTKAILKDPSGGTWVVTLKKNGTDLFFQCGWRSFVKCNFLEFGNLLVFTYAGNSIFNVKIYDKTGCEKNLSLAKKSSLIEQGKDSGRNRETTADDERTRLCVGGKKKNVLAIVLREEFSSQKEHLYATSTIRKANRQIVPRNYTRSLRGETSSFYDSEELSLEGACLVPEKDEEDSVEIMDDFEDQKITKVRNRGDDSRFIVGSSTIKRRKSTFGKDSLFEKQRRSITSSERPKFRPDQTLTKAGTYLFQRETGEISRRKDFIQSEQDQFDVSMESEDEVISIYSDTESEGMVNGLDASVPSRDDMVDDFTGRTLAYSTDEEVKSHDLEIGCGSEELLDHEDALDLSSENETVGLPIFEKHPHSSTYAKWRRHVTSQNRQTRAIQSANEFKSENPFCRVLMSATYITKSFMNLPCKFVKSLTRTSLDDCRIKRKLNVRLVSDGRMWLVTLAYKKNKAYFSTGWGKFVVENKLREGDICFFEMIKTGTLELKVSRCEATVTPARSNACRYLLRNC